LDTPVGEYIKISGAGFRIIGVFGEHGENEGEEERIFIPITTAQLAFNGADKINNMNFMLPEMESFDATVAKNKEFNDKLLAIQLFFWVVGFLTLIAGVVSVSNIMLIVVKERTREIGIRKALGAKPWSIIGMIMHEAIFVTAVAGFSGLIFSMGLLEIVGPNVEIDYVVNPSVSFNVALSTVILYNV